MILLSWAGIFAGFRDSGGVSAGCPSGLWGLALGKPPLHAGFVELDDELRRSDQPKKKPSQVSSENAERGRLCVVVVDVGRFRAHSAGGAPARFAVRWLSDSLCGG